MNCTCFLSLIVGYSFAVLKFSVEQDGQQDEQELGGHSGDEDVQNVPLEAQVMVMTPGTAKPISFFTKDEIVQMMTKRISVSKKTKAECIKSSMAILNKYIGKVPPGHKSGKAIPEEFRDWTGEILMALL